MPDLFTLDEAESLDIDRVHALYRRHVNRSQVSLMTSFGFGRELVDRAEGAYLYQRDGRRILDLTGGVGVLNHGHNHPRILAARQRFAERQRMEVHKTYFSPYLAALSHNLAAVLPADLTMSFLPNSGPRRWRVRSSWRTSTTTAGAGRSCGPTRASTASCSAPAG
ncbi:hypothetical protein Asp14428_22860 [Actinoplanes sp. NBRC 14428]|nr:hypothetical protein Asp14428_22860 [Actinoplanes sp. NBRC 14428]